MQRDNENILEFHNTVISSAKGYSFETFSLKTLLSKYQKFRGE